MQNPLKTMNEEDAIEVYKEEFEEAIKRKDDLMACFDFEPFKRLFIEFYTGEEIARCVKLIHTDRADIDEIFAKKVNAKIIGAGEFNRFIEATMTLGNQAVVELDKINNPEKYENTDQNDESEMNYA